MEDLEILFPTQDSHFDDPLLADTPLSNTLNTNPTPSLVALEDETTLQITELTPIASGFEIAFNRPIDGRLFNLYDGDDAPRSPGDIALQNSAGETVAGSAFLNDDLTGLTYIVTGDVLAADTYTVTVDSRDVGVVGADGELLDGNGDGTTGDTYQANFTIEDNEQRILGIADITRSPGQPLTVSEEDEGFFLSLNNAVDISSVELELSYNPALLTIDSFNLADNVPDDWTIEVSFPELGTAKFTLSGATALEEGQQNLIRLDADVPQTAPYGASHALKISNVVLNNGDIAGTGDSGVHQVALFGDVSGDGVYDSTDSYLIAKVGTGINSGFDAYEDTDPALIADINSNRELSALDAYKAYRQSQEGNLSEYPNLPNQAPVFDEPIESIEVVPGRPLSVPLAATDPEGSNVTYTLLADPDVPQSSIGDNNTLVFRAAPDQIGSYEITIVASDGELETRQTVTLEVVDDPLDTTRLSGFIQNTQQEPLAGVTIALDETTTTTDENGFFRLEFTEPLSADDFLRIIPGQEVDGVLYPSVSERLPLVLFHDPYTGFNNFIDRPIYLPAIDTENAETIDPSTDNTVTTDAIPGASVFVGAGTLETQEGEAFTGQLSITNVPRDLTPAAIPDNLMPDVLVTIQPGEMVFNTPAPLSLPNTAGYDPGIEMNLWSINPNTGEFDAVGTGIVSSDGSVIDTIEGGIRNSSWHFFSPPPEEPDDPTENPNNEENGCNDCKGSGAGSSEVEFHSGAVVETHNLVPYQSLGTTRGLTLTYDSMRADPRPIVHFGYSNARSGADRRLMAEMSINRGNLTYDVPGYGGGEFGLNGGEHFWAIPEADFTGAIDIDAALQANLRDLPSGTYTYELTTGLMEFNGESFNGSTVTNEGELIHVNSIGSNFGNGWGLSGLHELIENPDGSVLLVDGDSSELIFRLNEDGTYDPPAGDFSNLTKQDNGTFRRTLTDQTVYSFDANNRLSVMRDRNGNETRYQYNSAGNITRMIDPVGLETTFSYAGSRIRSITDPTGRTTQLQYDGAGNLIRLIDPDGTFRTWDYDDQYHMIGEIDKRGNSESASYDFAGRADTATRKDGSTIDVTPAQVRGLLPADATIDPQNSPEAASFENEAVATYQDANGDVTTYTLDQAGQIISASDDVGALPTTRRNDDNLVTSSIDARGNFTSFSYDDAGNVTSISDAISAPEIYVFSGGNEQGDETVLDAIEEAGYFPTLGVQTSAWDGTQTNLTNYAAVVLLNNYNWAGSSNMSVEGQNTLIDYVTAGGGLITGEWFGWNTSRGSYSELETIIPGTTAGVWNSSQLTTYTEDVENAILNEDLPDSFEFTLTNIAGTESFFTPKEGATSFYSSSNTEQSGLVGWDIDAGRVLSFSTLIAENELADQNYKTLFGNALDWVSEEAVTDVQPRTFTYDATFNQLTSITDELGRQTLYEIDEDNGNTLSITEVIGEVGGEDDLITRFSYTPQGLIDTTTDPLGRVTDYDYNDLGLLTSIAYAKDTTDEATERFEYDAAGNQTAAVDGLGNRTTFEYDALNRLTKITEPDPDGEGDLASPVTTFTYDEAGNQISITDAEDSTTANRFDALNRLTQTTDELEQTTRYQYDGMDNLISVTDPLGHQTVNRYDVRDRLIETIDPENNVTFFSYDLDNNLISVSETVEPIIELFTEDFEDDLSQWTGKNGGETNGIIVDDPLQSDKSLSFTALASGGDIFTTELFEQPNRTYRLSFDYLALPEEGSNESDMGGFVGYSPNLNGGFGTQWLFGTSRNSSGLKPEFIEFDTVGTWQPIVIEFQEANAFHLILEDFSSSGGVAGDIYFDNIRLEAIPTPERFTTFEYDSRDRLTQETDQLGNSTNYEYDAVDNLTASIDRNDRRTEFVYDDVDRLTTEIWVVTDGEEGENRTANQIDYSYDKATNLISVGDDFSSLTYTYDNRDRVRTVDNTGTPNVPPVILGYSYDDASNVIAVADSINSTEAGTNTYAYDGLNRLTTLTQSGNGISNKRVDFAYNQIGQYASINRYRNLDGTGLVTSTSYAYDDLNRLTDLTHNNGTSDIAFYNFGYDAASRIAELTDVDGTTTYTYDDRDQLTAANHEDPDNPDEAYTYDADGNRVTSHLHGDGYETIGNNRIVSDGTYAYTYDNEGNQLTRTEIATGNVEEYEWDYRNRLVAVVSKDADGTITQRVEFTYDGFDRRISKTVISNPDTESETVNSTHFVYDGEDVLLEFVDADGAAGEAAPTLDKRYLHGAGTDQVLAQEEADGAVYWHLTDHLGTIRDLVSHDGTLVNHITYDSFGQIIEQTNPAIDTRYLFTGREFDTETGLYYYRARYYDAVIGQFISEDPIGFLSGDTNLYRYVFNSPITNNDPSGNAVAAAPVVFIPGVGQVVAVVGGLIAGGILLNEILNNTNSQDELPSNDNTGSVEEPAINCPIPDTTPGQPVSPPSNLPAFPDAKPAKTKTPVQGGGGKRKRWKDSKGNIYEWDRQHGAVEVYDKKGKHKGEFDPNTGQQTKPPKPGRKVEP